MKTQTQKTEARIQESGVTPPPATAYLHEGLVRVCMCCHPGDSIYERYPHWRGLGLRISHGLCTTHKAEMLAQCAEMKEAA